MNTIRPLLILILSLASFSLAKAHAFLDHADPKVGSTVNSSPPQVELWMTEDLEPAFTKVQVFNSSGAQVDKKDAKISGSTMIVSLPNLPPGNYKVVWKAVAIDTHLTTGTFTFTVK
ncbi:MAG TPA: copper resistance CopC family protein [Candidatus Methylacidiphilales bacterium]|nr:copper resistance CopC family protein [Candidatus Methylacidiphilales bacterium]